VDGGLKNLTVLPSKSTVLPLLQRPKTIYLDLSYPAIVGAAQPPVGTLTVPFQIHCPECVALVIEVKSVLLLISSPTPLRWPDGNICQRLPGNVYVLSRSLMLTSFIVEFCVTRPPDTGDRSPSSNDTRHDDTERVG
jgi:hypothetical protein